MVAARQTDTDDAAAPLRRCIVSRANCALSRTSLSKYAQFHRHTEKAVGKARFSSRPRIRAATAPLRSAAAHARQSVCVQAKCADSACTSWMRALC